MRFEHNARRSCQTPRHLPRPARRSRRNPPTLLDSTELSIVEAGRLAFLSGQTATPRDPEEMPTNPAGQADVVARNLATALEELGASPRDLATFRVYVVDATTDRFGDAWSPIRQMLGGEKPSMIGVGVQALWTPAVQIDVETVVRLP